MAKKPSLTNQIREILGKPPLTEQEEASLKKDFEGVADALREHRKRDPHFSESINAIVEAEVEAAKNGDLLGDRCEDMDASDIAGVLKDNLKKQPKFKVH